MKRVIILKSAKPKASPVNEEKPKAEFPIIKRKANAWLLLLFSAILALFAGLFGSSTTSPAFLGYSFGPNDFDSSFFMNLGSSFLSGKTPYLEIFDHKGLYIFCLEALGMAMGGRTGVFLLQWVLSALSLFLILLSIREMGYGKFSYLVAGLSYVLLLVCFKYGNHTGELIMPWVALPLYFYIVGLKRKQERFFLLGNFFAGVEAGIGFSSRPSEAMWGLALVIFYFVYYLWKERNWNLLWNALVCLLGFAISLAPSIILALSGGYLKAMIDAVIGQSLAYVGNHPDPFRIWARLVCLIVSLIFLFLSFLVGKREGKEMGWFFFVVTLITGAINIIIARFPHYWLSSFPLLLLAATFSLCPKDEMKLKRPKLWKGLAISLATLDIVVSSVWMGLYYIPSKALTIANDGEIGSVYKLNQEACAQLDAINESDPDKNEEVYPVDCNAGVLVYLGRLSSCRFVADQSWWATDNPTVLPETKDFIVTEKPVWIVTSNHGLQHEESLWSLIKSSYSVYSSGYYLTVYHID